MKPPISLAVVGAGNRGTHAYASYARAFPAEARVVAVAEPDPVRRAYLEQEHDIDPHMSFTSWEELLYREQVAEGVIVATQDQLHVEPAVAAMEKGYHVLLEKPMAHTVEGCVRLVQAAERTGRLLQIGHVMRYAPFFETLHAVLASGRLGDIITVEHRENVSFWHMAHSFVRGNWRRSDQSNPMILAKCCHDLDVLHWNLGRRVERLSSFGSLLHYRSDQVGPEIPLRCTDGCPIEPECPFSAIGFYLELRPFRQWAQATGRPILFDPDQPDAPFFRAITEDLSYAGRQRAIETGPYGRCVYHCDNDVVDHQVVSMEFEGGISCVLVMHGHSYREGRTMRYDGTRATLRGAFHMGGDWELTVHDHATGAVEAIPIPAAEGRPGHLAGHGGGDWRLMAGFLKAIRGEAPPLTDARTSLESHLMAFAAEEARHQHTVVEMDEYRARVERLAAG